MMRPYWIGGILFGMVFAVFMAARFDFFSFPGKNLETERIVLPERDTWMHLFQGDQKIGFSHSILRREGDGYGLEQTVHMRLNTMGLIQDVTLNTESVLHADLSVRSFDFTMNSGRFVFKAKGTVLPGKLTVAIEGTGSEKPVEIPVNRPLHLASALYDAVIASGMRPGDTRSFEVFDIASLGRAPVTVTLQGKEAIPIMGASRAASRLTIDFKGLTQTAWISEEGEVLREEGLLGLRLEKTDPVSAVAGVAFRPNEDLTRFASVPISAPIRNPKTLNRLSLLLEGISPEGLDLHGGRQVFTGKTLVIEKESLSGPEFKPLDPKEAAPFLQSTPFIQAADETLATLSRRITASRTDPLEKIRTLMEWIQENIEKQPAMTLPDALSVLKNRSGDCNEHAVLFAALARASGIPTRVEAGLVYLEGRFFYHAWNLSHVGRWITVDALFNEIPADVTHIRLVGDAEKKQLNLLPVIGKIQLSVTAAD